MPAENIICEYGMSELSSQAYDTTSLKSDASASKVSEVPAGFSISAVGAGAGGFAGNRTGSGGWRNGIAAGV